MKAWLRWFDERTGSTAALRALGDQPLPAGCCSRALAAWPSVICFTFFVEAVTGLFLWMFYSPSAQTAWESVYYVQHEVLGGEVLRGIHYHAGQVLLAVIGLYVLHMIFARAYRAPREVVFWLAVLMALVTLALLLTGDVLAWTQKGYWSTNVRTNFLLLIPWVGGALHRLAIGGPEMGHLTLTRFFALHAGLFSAVFATLLWLHHRMARRAAEKEIESGTAVAGRSWPEQTLWNAAACAVVAVVIGAMVSTGVELGSPRDPIDAYAAARPDWYFVGVYQFANFFPGSLKIVPIFVVPGLLVVLFLAMPLIGRRLAGHAANVAVTLGLLLAAGVLTWMAVEHDRTNPSHQASLAAEQADAARVIQLVEAKGIPSSGALSLLRDDPKTQGPKLFKQHCASCHDDATPEGQGILAEKPSAPNLHEFASVEWLKGFLDVKQIAYAPKPEEQSPTNRPKYFGGSKLKEGKMQKFLKDDLKTLKKEIDDGEKAFQKLIEALAAESHRKPGEKPKEETLLLFEDFTCTSSGCHRFYSNGKAGTAPDLTGYGSREWLLGIIGDPTQRQFYGGMNDRMPSYVPPGSPDKNLITPRQLEMLVDWMRGQWYEPEVSQ